MPKKTTKQVEEVVQQPVCPHRNQEEQAGSLKCNDCGATLNFIFPHY